MKILPAMVLILWVLSGCVKKADWTPPQSAPVFLAVDALLTDEVKTQEIKLSLPVSHPDSFPKPFSNATVLVSNEDSTWQLTENQLKPGVYQTPAWFSAKVNRNYTLIISKNGEVFTAHASMSAALPFQQLRYIRNESDGLYHIDWVANAFSVADASMWEVLMDWSQVQGYRQADSSKTHARLLFYTLPTLDVSEVFAPRMESVFFPAGTVITERRYALSPEHAAFIREMLLETNWTGGLFSTASSSPGTNLSAGAVGYFGVCGVYELSIIAGK